MAFLTALSSEDFGVFLEGKDFIGVQDSGMESRQEVSWRGMHGIKGPAIRLVRHADEDTFNFSAVILKDGAAKGLNRMEQVQAMTDFEISLREGTKLYTKRNCNWTRIAIRHTATEATLDVDISIPGYGSELGA